MKSKVVVKISGGLGNQLFQLAFLRYLEDHLHRQIYVDLSEYGGEGQSRSFELQSLGFDLRNIAILSRDLEKSLQELIEAVKQFSPRHPQKLFLPIVHFVKAVFREKAIPHFKWKSRLLPLTLHLPVNHLFIGNWQEEEFILGVGDRLLAELENQRRNKVVLAELFNFEADVALHVRRGDYLASDSIHINMSTEYYNKAILLMEDNPKTRAIIVFSDDPEWCRLNIKSKKDVTIFSDLIPEVSLSDELLYFMSFKNRIISNSTFSLFPTLICQQSVKMVIAPKAWYRNLNTPSPVSMYPKEWITI
jgi:hypothetical protein